MLDLLTKYSLHEVIIFLVIFSAAIKGVFDFWDWLKNKVYSHFKKEQTVAEKDDRQDEILQEIMKVQDQLSQENKEIKKTLSLLVESDKDAIKSFIVKEHRHYVYELKCIDDYSLDVIEKRYEHYKEEGGNSYIHLLIEELRALPRAYKEG